MSNCFVWVLRCFYGKHSSHLVAVLKWIRAAGTTLEPVKADKEADIVMIDDFWHFVNGKKTKFGYGEPFAGITSRALGWHISNRSDASLRRLLDKIDDGKCHFVTDECSGFFRLLSEGRHFYGKDLTYPIEATHSDLRHGLARFHKRSKLTSRSLSMVQASLNIFHHLQSQGNLILLFFLFFG